MANLPPAIVGICIGLGLDLNDPNWIALIQDYRNTNPLVDVGDYSALTHFQHFLNSRMETQDNPPQSTQPGSGNPAPVPASDSSDIIRLFREVAEQLRTTVSTHHGTTPKDATLVKIADPPKFTGGDRKKLKSWMAHIRLKISNEHARFPTERSKVAFALSYLSDLAFQHYEPDILRGLESPGAPDHLKSLDGFLDHLDSTFGDRGSENSALREITSIQQGNGAAHTYYTKFTHITPYLDWEGTAFRDLFYKGLRDEIKDELAKQPLASTLETLATQAIEIDNRFYERRQDKRNLGGTSSTGTRTTSHRTPQQPNLPLHRPRSNSAPASTKPTHSTSHNASAPYPMEIDSAAPRSRLTPQEKQRRKESGLCLYCGQPGHFANKCPLKQRSKPQFGQYQRSKVSAISYTISDPNFPPSSAEILQET